MPQLIPIGPYRTLKTIEGVPFPYYIIPFDEQGRCEGPLTREHLLDNAASYSDIFLFAHGWNNDWSVATRRYENFINGFQSMRREFGLTMPEGYLPLLVGIFWPSQAMEWFDSETGPTFAAADPDVQDAATAVAWDLLRDVAACIQPDERERFFMLAQASALSQQDALDFAGMLADTLRGDDEGMVLAPPSASDLIAAAQSLTEQQQEPDFDAIGIATPAVVDGTPEAALNLGNVFRALDPRNLIKPFTVWQMKGRAGLVGDNGVGDLLAKLLHASRARVHLIGHSFGCKVVMNAVRALPEGTRRVHSALLLQPAVSQYAFATKVPERPGVGGGFLKALDRVVAPVVCTFSANDVALTRMFHLALRRHSDLGEEPVAAAGGPPSIYAALGGYGPQGSRAAVVDIKNPIDRYDWGGGGKLVAVQATRTIGGHGDISNPSTWWLAYSLSTAPLQ